MAEKGTEAPTAKRRKDSRKEGQVARSAELSSWALVLVGSALIPALVSYVHRGVVELISQWDVAATEADSSVAARSALTAALRLSLVASIAFAAALAVVGAFITITQVGFSASTKAIKPKLDRVNPVKGLKRLFSIRSVWQTGKQLFLVTVLSIMTWLTAAGLTRELHDRGGLYLGDALAVVAADVTSFVRMVAAIGLAFAVGDYAFQRRQMTKDLKMTKQQVRDEYKQSDGDPMVRQRIRTLMRDAARARMLQDVPTASVVVVNPTHFAVALRYRSGTDPAPMVVAAGVDKVAARIRQSATQHGVPIVAAPALARTLHRHCEIGQVIPGVLYQAVAHVLAVLARRRGMNLGDLSIDVDVPDLGVRSRGRASLR